MEKDDILVSICCVTYNHEAYIKKSLDGFIMQKTTFKYEILVHDDASTDDTSKIIKEYEHQYPTLFRCVYQSINQFALKNNPLYILTNLALGKYIALCEGDDYWTDSYKLQKQVELLESYNDCNYTFTKNLILKKQDGNIYSKFNSELKLPPIFDLHFLLKSNIMPPTQSVVFRKSALPHDISSVFNVYFHGDWLLLFLIAGKGKIGFVNEYTCVYREGVGIISNTNTLYKFKNGLELNKHLNKYTNYVYDYCIGKYEFHYENITYAYLQNGQKLFGILYFFLKIIHSLKNNKLSNFYINNLNFTKHSIKLFLKFKDGNIG